MDNTRKGNLESKNKQKHNSIKITLSLALMISVFTMTPASSFFQIAQPAMAAPLSNVRILPSTNVVNEKANYDFFFTTATTGTIQYIVMVFPPSFDTSQANKLIERSGIGPGSFTIVPGPTPQQFRMVYVVNDPVSIPAGTEIRLEIGPIINSNTVGRFSLIVSTLDTNETIIDRNIPAPFFAIKAITSEDVSPSFMKRKTLLDNAAGHAKGWNPGGRYDTITDSDISGSEESVFVSAIIRHSSVSAICQVYNISTASGTFRIVCNPVVLPEDAILDYIIYKLPPNVIRP